MMTHALTSPPLPNREGLDEALFANGEMLPAVLSTELVDALSVPPAPSEEMAALPDADRMERQEETAFPIQTAYDLAALTASLEQGPRGASEEGPEVLSLELNTGLALEPGDNASITRDHLRIVGTKGPHLIDLMLLSPPLAGAVLRDGFALTGGDVFTQEDIDQGRISYRHAGGDEVEDAFAFATPDGAIEPTAVVVTIHRRRQAPLLSGKGRFECPREGGRVEDLLNGTAQGEPGARLGLALVAVQGRGSWQYSLDASGEWRDVNEVHHGKALLLGPSDWLRFEPREGWSGTVKVTYRAWDPSHGTAGTRVNLAPRYAIGGATGISQGLGSASARIEATMVPPAVAAVEPWVGQPTVVELAGGGLAVVRLIGEGTWQYALEGANDWRDLGPVYHGRARLLGPTHRVRFLPRPGWSGRVSLVGRPWDGRDGAPGGTVNLAPRTACGDGTPFGEQVVTRVWYRVA